MPKLADDKPVFDKRLGVSLDASLHTALLTLARLEGKPPAVKARQILAEYLDARADIIAQAQKADDDYQRALADIRDRNRDQ